MDVKDLIVTEQNTLKRALEVLNDTAMGIAFVTNDKGNLTGILTDGDIRRALLKDAMLDTVVADVMNKSFLSLPVDTENSKILEHLNTNFKVIPLVNKENHLVDYASIKKIRNISVASPLLTGNELAYVTDCINTNWISSQGKYVRKFEELFTDFHEGRQSLAVSNGTVALHLALVALGIGPGDEVLVPDLTFAASVNAIIYTGATPVLVDVDSENWNIDVVAARKLISARTKAIMPVHLYGYPCDMKAIGDLAGEFKLFVVEDCAEALGSYYYGRPVGVFGDVATFSFYGNKTITTGEGGMLVFKDEKIAERAAMLRDHGMDKSRRYWHQEVGYNYRLTNVQAAIGVAQFERLGEFVDAKRNIAKSYNKTLKNYDYFQLPPDSEDVTNSYWLYTCMVKPEAPFTRDELISFLGQHGIETRPVFFPMHTMPPYTGFGAPETLRVSAHISASGISFPSSVSLTATEVSQICDCIVKFAKKFKYASNA